MSFAYDVKAELCKVPINRSCCAVAEGCGVLLYASAFTANEVRIVTENDEFAARLPKLFQKAFSLRFDELPDKSKDGGKLVSDPNNVFSFVFTSVACCLVVKSRTVHCISFRRVSMRY